MAAEVAAEVAVFVAEVAQEVAEVALQEVVAVVVALGVEEDSRLALCNIIVLPIFHLQCFEKRLQESFVCTVFYLELNLLVLKLLPNLILLQILMFYQPPLILQFVPEYIHGSRLWKMKFSLSYFSYS